MYEKRGHSSQMTRRQLLATAGATGTLALAGCVGNGDDDPDEGDTEDDTIRIGVSLPETGSRSEEGARLRDGYELAVEHLNDGTGPITETPWDDVSADGGLLGETVELLFEDTGGTESGATDAATGLLQEDIEMLTGGVSGVEGSAHQEALAEADDSVLYMGGFVPTDDASGQLCHPHAFNEMYNPTIAARSLGEVLGDELGADEAIEFVQLAIDSPFGQEFSQAMGDELSNVGREWFELTTSEVGAGVNYEGDIEDLLSRRPDLIVLNIYGTDGERALRNLETVINEDEELEREEITIATPIISPEMAENAGTALEDVYGTVHWMSGLGSDFSDAFEDSWDGDRSTDEPSQFAHLAYVQVAQYAAAVERASSTEPDDVAEELNGQTYTVGMGEQELRSEDGQAMRYAPVVRGRDAQAQAPGSYYELVASVPDAVENPPYTTEESPAALCDR